MYAAVRKEWRWRQSRLGFGSFGTIWPAICLSRARRWRLRGNIPARPKRSEADRVALREAAAKWHETMAAAGLTEEEAMEDFKQLRAADRK